MKRNERHVPHRHSLRRGAAILASVLMVVAMGMPQGRAASYSDDTAARLPALPDNAQALAYADVNGDTHVDVLVAANGQPRLLINDGTGHFADETAARLPTLTGAFMGAVFVDLTGDGRPELFLANAAGQNRLLVNDGAGVFTDQTATRLPVDSDRSLAVAAGDVNGDGFVDFVVANRGTQNRLLINNGSAVFTDQSAARLPADADPSYGVALADVDGNGSLDIFVANAAGQDRLYINNNLGVFTDQTAARLPAVQNDSLHAVAADVNHDGKPDLVVAGGGDGPRLLLNDGTGTFAAQSLPGQPEYALRVAVGDIDFDGNPDILVANAGQDRVLLGDGAASPSFTDATASLLPNDDRRSYGVALFDFDHDLDLDQVVAGLAGEERALSNFIAEPRVLVSLAPTYLEVGNTVTIDVTAFDEDGVSSTDVTVTDPDNVATPVTLSGVTQGTGTYTLPASNAKAGPYTVTVVSTDTTSAVSTHTTMFTGLTTDLTAPTVSIALSTASPIFGQAVNITVSASDDRGVTGVSLSVNGMSVPLDSSGMAMYVTSALGTFDVDAQATDAHGNVGNAPQVQFTVTDDVSPPAVTVTATPDPVDITQPVSVHVVATDNVSIASLTAKVEGPGTPADGTPIALDGSGNGSYTPYVPGSYTVTGSATDPKGNIGTGTATFDAQGVPDTELPVVTLSVTPTNVAQNHQVQIHASATDNILVSSLTVDVDGVPVTLDGAGNATFTSLVLGDHTVHAQATDPTGNVGVASQVFHTVDPSADTTPPTAMITSPAQFDEVGLNVTVVGTANDDVAVSQYVLEVAPVSSGIWTQFAQGFAPVVNGTLGTLNTATMKNGTYDIRLTVSDLNSHVTQITRSVAIGGTFKPGVFAHTWTEMKLTVAGTPIKIQRRYDSRERDDVGDFGNGWSVQVLQAATYSNNIPVGESWDIQSTGGFFDFPCGASFETATHVTEIRVSDTEFYQFVPKFTPDSELGIAGACTGYASFVQVGGVPGATLEEAGGSTYLLLLLGQGTLVDEDFNVYNPSTVRLTTIDGRKLDINLNQGLTRIADRNNNAITISPSGVTHSSGKSITFTRDGQGRITQITDPLGHSITYNYDGNGDLAMLTDRAGNTTQFTYYADHFLHEIIDGRGIPVLSNTYDSDGLLVSQSDADGNTTTYTHDLANGSETIETSDGTTEELVYGDNGRIAQATKNGVSKSFTYDDNNNILTETDGEGNVKTFTYNANNQITSESDGAGNFKTYAYDAQSRIASLTANGKTLTFGYDANGNPTSMTDGNGNALQTITYDTLGNPSSRRIGQRGLRLHLYGRRIAADGQRTERLDAHPRLRRQQPRHVDGACTHRQRQHRNGDDHLQLRRQRQAADGDRSARPHGDLHLRQCRLSRIPDRQERQRHDVRLRRARQQGAHQQSRRYGRASGIRPRPSPDVTVGPVGAQPRRQRRHPGSRHVLSV